MILCSDGHDEICYDGHKCPVCEVNSICQKLEKQIETLQKKLEDLGF